MADIITTLHPENDAETNLYPNIKKENIPEESIDRSKLDDGVNSLLDNFYSLNPSGVDTSSNILSKTSDDGIWIGSDTGHWYYWNGSTYIDGGVYQATAIADNSIKLSMFSDQLNFDYRQYPHNLFYGSTDGYYRDYRTGKIETFSDFTMSHFIEIEPDRDYYTNMEGHICYFDENQTYISGTLTYQSGYSGSIHTPVNARYLVMSFWKRHKEIATLHTGTRFKWTLPYTYDVVDYSIIRPKLYIGNNMPLNNLFEAFEFIRSRGISNTDIIIRSGVYDLATEIGDTYISNFDPYTNDFRGLALGNGNHIKGEGNVVINLRLPITANTPFRTDVSVFHAYSNSFTLENVTINAENVRYCVHDDTDVIDGYNSIHKFINCTFNDYGTTSGACIGGGLHSVDGQVIIESCRCYIVGSRSEKDKQIGIYYHSYANTGRYIIRITDTKIYNGFCFLGQYQSPTNYIYMYVSNSQMMEIPHIYGFQDNPPKWLVDTPITYDYFSMEYWNIDILIP